MAVLSNKALISEKKVDFFRVCVDAFKENNLLGTEQVLKYIKKTKPVLFNSLNDNERKRLYRVSVICLNQKDESVFRGYLNSKKKPFIPQKIYMKMKNDLEMRTLLNYIEAKRRYFFFNHVKRHMLNWIFKNNLANDFSNQTMELTAYYALKRINSKGVFPRCKKIKK